MKQNELDDVKRQEITNRVKGLVGQLGMLMYELESDFMGFNVYNSKDNSLVLSVGMGLGDKGLKLAQVVEIENAQMGEDEGCCIVSSDDEGGISEYKEINNEQEWDSAFGKATGKVC